MERIRHTNEELKKRSAEYKKRYLERQKENQVHVVRISLSDEEYRRIYDQRIRTGIPMTKICAAAIRTAIMDRYIADRKATLGKNVIDFSLEQVEYQHVQELAKRSRMTVTTYCRTIIPVMIRKEGYNADFQKDKDDVE